MCQRGCAASGVARRPSRGRSRVPALGASAYSNSSLSPDAGAGADAEVAVVGRMAVGTKSARSM
jgi:hypothetical protein